MEGSVEKERSIPTRGSLNAVRSEAPGSGVKDKENH